MNIKNLKTIFSIVLILGLFAFSGLVNAQQDYDVINLDASNYNYDPAPITPGDEFELWIQLTNNSNNAAENIDFLLELEYPFSLADYDELNGNISYIAPYQTKILKYNLKSDFLVNSDTYTIKFKYKRSGVDVYNVEEYNIDITSQNAIIDIISSDIEKVDIGKSSNINLNLKNLSLQNAKDVFVTLNNSSDDKIKVLNLTTKYIAKLNAGQEINLQYSVLADRTIENKSYSLPITISYSDSQGDYNISRTVGLEIIGNPEVLLNIISIGENYKLYTNDVQEIEFEIYNVGNIDAESVYVEANGDFLVASSKYFVGSIEKDNYDSVDLELNIKDMPSGTYNLEVIINYKDGDLIEQKITQNIPVEVVNKSKGGNTLVSVVSTIGYIIAVIFGLSLIIIIIRWLLKILVFPAFGISSISKNKKKK
jgi:hypothetical protein